MNTKHTKYTRKKKRNEKKRNKNYLKNAFMYLCLPLSSVSVKVKKKN